MGFERRRGALLPDHGRHDAARDVAGCRLDQVCGRKDARDGCADGRHRGDQQNVDGRCALDARGKEGQGEHFAGRLVQNEAHAGRIEAERIRKRLADAGAILCLDGAVERAEG